MVGLDVVGTLLLIMAISQFALFLVVSLAMRELLILKTRSGGLAKKESKAKPEGKPKKEKRSWFRKKEDPKKDEAKADPVIVF